MKLSRLLRPKLNIAISIQRISTKKVNLCSSVCPNGNRDRTPRFKKDAVAEEKREMTVESVENESAQIKSEIISKAALSMTKKGASRYRLQEVVHILKGKMLGTDNQQNCYTVDASAPADCSASRVIASKEVLDHGTGELQDSEATTVIQTGLTLNDENRGVNLGKSCMAREVCNDLVNASISEVNQMLVFPQPPETEYDGFNTKKVCTPSCISSPKCEHSSEEASQTNDSELVVEEAKYLKSDEFLSHVFPELEEEPSLNHKNLSYVLASTSSLYSTECVKEEQNEMITGNRSVDLGSEGGVVYAPYDGSKKTVRLLDLFGKQNHDNRSTKAEIKQKMDPEKALSDMLLSFQRKRVLKFQHSSSTRCLLPEAETSVLKNDHVKEISLIGCKTNLQEDKTLRFEMVEDSFPSNGSQKVSDSKDWAMNLVSDQIIDENFHPYAQFEHSNEPSEVDAEKHSDINDLINFIKIQEGVPSNTANDNRDTDLMRENPSNTNSQRFAHDDCLSSSEFSIEKSRIENEETSDLTFRYLDGTELNASAEILNSATNEKLRNSNLSDLFNSSSQNFIDSGRLDVPDFTSGESRIDDEEKVDLDFQPLGCTELKAGMEIPNPTMKTDGEKLENTLSSGEDVNGNKVVVRFLHKAITKEDILETFERFGPISKFEISDVERPLFKSACIYFKTKEGLQRAIKERVITVREWVVTVESATSMENVTQKISVPNLISDPDVPTVLIKNPSRTIKIKNLTRDISSHHIEEALSFCESHVSGYFLGSTNSVAFVEFETEIGKERALLQHSINVLGKQLAVLRIDAPRTTVVRVSCVNYTVEKNVISICKSLGKTRAFQVRAPGIIDVHYSISEWPNMWLILNRLNGVKVQRRRLRAGPAPVFPPDILLGLWHQPEGRKCLKTVALTLLQKLRKCLSTDTSQLDNLGKILAEKF